MLINDFYVLWEVLLSNVIVWILQTCHLFRVVPDAIKFCLSVCISLWGGASLNAADAIVGCTVYPGTFV